VRFSKSTQKLQIFLLVPPDGKNFQPKQAGRFAQTGRSSRSALGFLACFFKLFQAFSDSFSLPEKN
jgi:hypothetical protein